MAKPHALMGVPFQERKSDQCANPLWGDSVRIGLVCGRATTPGHSYCPDCANRMTIPLPQSTIDAIVAAQSSPDRYTSVGHIRKGRASRGV